MRSLVAITIAAAVTAVVAWHLSPRTAPEPTTVEPAAPDAVRVALCEAKASELRLDDVTIRAARSCGRRLPRPHQTLDVVLGPASLATQGVCDAWAAGTKCPEDARCLASSNAAQTICGCTGGGHSRLPEGGYSIRGLWRTWRGVDASSCPPQAHNGCAIMLEMTRAQFHVLRAVVTDDDPRYPGGLKTVLDGMRADPFRARRRSDVPACLRPNIPVRMGRGDIEGGANFDTGVQ